MFNIFGRSNSRLVRLIYFAPLLLLAALLVFGHAFAQTADTGAVSTAVAAAANPNAVLLGPLVTWLDPLLTIIAKGLAGIAVTIIAAKAYQWFGISSDATQVARMKSAAQTAAGGLVAEAEDSLKGQSISVSDPKIARAANDIIARLPGVAAAIGATPDRVAIMIHGELGKLQAGQVTPDPLVVAKAT